MDSLLIWLASLPELAIDGIIGVITSALVALGFRSKVAQHAVVRWREGPLGWLPLWVPIVSVVFVISTEISQVVIPRIHAATFTLVK